MSSFGESYTYSLGSDYRSVAVREETENANMKREHMLEQRYAYDQRQKHLIIIKYKKKLFSKYY